jgi:hypothetical protein
MDINKLKALYREALEIPQSEREKKLKDTEELKQRLEVENREKAKMMKDAEFCNPSRICRDLVSMLEEEALKCAKLGKTSAVVSKTIYSKGSTDTPGIIFSDQGDTSLSKYLDGYQRSNGDAFFSILRRLIEKHNTNKSIKFDIRYGAGDKTVRTYRDPIGYNVFVNVYCIVEARISWEGEEKQNEERDYRNEIFDW